MNLENINAGRDVIAISEKHPREKSLLIVAIVVVVTMGIVGVAAIVGLQHRTSTEPGNGEELRTVLGEHPMERSRIEKSFPVVEIGPDPEQADHAGASVKILGAALLDDGQLEVRGEVRPVELTDPKTIREYLRTLEVRVTLADEIEVPTMIDVERSTWKVSLRPRRRPKLGERLKVEAVLLGESGSHELHRVWKVLLVEESGSQS